MTIARVPSLVVTLGTLYVIRGIDGALGRRQPGQRLELPDSFNKIGYGTVLGVPYLGIIAIVAVAIATYAMRTLPDGARLLRDRLEPGGRAPRRHPGRLARLPRLRPQRRRSPGSPGALWLSLFGSVDAIAGAGYEFQVIAAVVVGGVAIFGGSGTVLGAALGALLLNTIDSALVVVNVSSFWSQAVAGALLLGAIAFDRLIAVRVAPALRTRRRAVAESRTQARRRAPRRHRCAPPRASSRWETLLVVLLLGARSLYGTSVSPDVPASRATSSTSASTSARSRSWRSR